MRIEKESFFKKLDSTIEKFIEEVEATPLLSLDDFSPKDSLVVMIDMVNGFCKFGALSSVHVKEIIPKMGSFLDACIQKEFPILAYCDMHTSDKAQEFAYYPVHCVKGSDESEIVDELQRDEIEIVSKNSTNGFLAQNPLDIFSHVKNIIVIGCVTDICISDFSTTMSKYFQEKDIDGKVFVVENLVDTFQIDGIHEREVEHILALYHMKTTGVKFLRHKIQK